MTNLLDMARQAIDPADITVTSVGADPDSGRVVDRGRYCPAPLPCFGRPAVGLIMPVRANGGPVVDELPATSCPLCGTWRLDERETLP